ncbi:MAG: PhnD/SsuA/transferrin family substrate-binding protein [Pseudomonadota bacterium]|nr:MAG: PhnD/SsuA/transferrin family substrate-binding protein [Pseudomonadota bacterium]
MPQRTFVVVPVLFTLSLFTSPLTAADARSGTYVTAQVRADSLRQASFAPREAPNSAAQALTASDALVFTAPPRESAEEGARRFGPVAAHLSEVLGRKVIYRHPGTWGAYQAEMLKGNYDLVFDAPHFNGWRIERLGHNVLAKVPGDYTYTIFTRKDNARVQDIKQLAGHKICAHAPPHLGTLVMWNQFDNPARQPTIIVTSGYKQVYEALMAGRCEAGVLSVKHLKKYDPDNIHTRVVFKNRPLPQQAFSAGPRLTADEQARVGSALLALAGKGPLQAMGEAYGFSAGLVGARNDEYAGLGAYLKNEWGYY